MTLTLHKINKVEEGLDVGGTSKQPHFTSVTRFRSTCFVVNLLYQQVPNNITSGIYVFCFFRKIKRRDKLNGIVKTKRIIKIKNTKSIGVQCTDSVKLMTGSSVNEDAGDYPISSPTHYNILSPRVLLILYQDRLNLF